LFEYAFIGFVLFKRNNIIKTNVFRTIIKSKILLAISCTYILIHVIILIIFCRVVILDNILSNFHPIDKVLITLGVFIVIIFDICSVWLVAALTQIKERYKNKYGKELKL
jgi:hypothetical protein